MDIKKLGLISTVAMLSVTISLGGCDNIKPKEAESAA
ncbi:small effector proten [Candidatus Liberibacter solanacearum]